MVVPDMLKSVVFVSIALF